MSHSDIGPKERALREMKERKMARKPSPEQLRDRVAKIKPKPKKSKKGRR